MIRLWMEDSTYWLIVIVLWQVAAIFDQFSDLTSFRYRLFVYRENFTAPFVYHENIRRVVSDFMNCFLR